MVVVNFANIAIMIAVTAAFADPDSPSAKPRVPALQDSIQQALGPSWYKVESIFINS